MTRIIARNIWPSKLIDVDLAGDDPIAERRRADPAEVSRAVRAGASGSRPSVLPRWNYRRFGARADGVPSFADFVPLDSVSASSQRSAQWPIAVNAGCSACPFLLSA